MAAQKLIDLLIDRAVADFEIDPLSIHLLRRLVHGAPDQFCIAALRHLETNENSDAHRFLSTLMLRQPSILFDQLMNPVHGSKERARHLFRRMLAVDPSFDMKLARRLSERAGTNGYCDTQSVERSIDILSEASSGRRLLPVIGHLVDSENARISGKAALLVGLYLRDPEWVARQLKRDDARIRANSIESLWGLRSLRVKNLLEQCLEDSSGRVKGNSLVGLHLFGETTVIPKVVLLAADTNYAYRSTAAWVMGRIGDLGFAPQLTALLRDEHPQVRGAALRSLIALRRIEPKGVQVE